MASDSLIKTLAPIYNNCVRTISGLLPSTPADSACIEAGRLPFRFVVRMAVCNKAVAYAAKTSGDERIFLLQEGERLLRTVANTTLPPVAKVNWNGSKSWRSHPIHNDSRIKDHFRAGDNSVILRRSVAEFVHNKYPAYTHRYTDGSVSRLGVGIGIAGDIQPLSLSLPPQCSIFSAEAAAIFLAVTTPSDRPILILSDSASVISALQSETPSHPWIQDIMQCAPPTTTFAWIPGHCSIPGNTKADHLAGIGPNGPRCMESVPLMDLKRSIVSIFHDCWTKEWHRIRIPFIRKVKGSIGPWEDLPVLRDQRIISRLRTGHTRLSYNMSGTPFRRICDICRVHQSVEHILCVCPQYRSFRLSNNLAFTVRDILADNQDGLIFVRREMN